MNAAADAADLLRPSERDSCYTSQLPRPFHWIVPCRPVRNTVLVDRCLPNAPYECGFDAVPLIFLLKRAIFRAWMGLVAYVKGLWHSLSAALSTYDSVALRTRFEIRTGVSTPPGRLSFWYSTLKTVRVVAFLQADCSRAKPYGGSEADQGKRGCPGVPCQVKIGHA